MPATVKIPQLLIVRHTLYVLGRPRSARGVGTWKELAMTVQVAPGASLESLTELAELLRLAMRRLRRGTREALAPLGLSGSEASVMRMLASGSLRMSVIAGRLAVVPRTVTDIVDGAELAGFVTRLADPGDRRSTLVELTPAGRRLLDQLDSARRQSAARVFGWDNNDKPGVQLNQQFVISQEQLEQIRALRES